MERRTVLIGGSLSSVLTVFPLGRTAWAARSGAPPGKRLIVVMLRGGADGLNIVVPYGEGAYYDARPSVAIGPPGAPHGALDLDGHFGLHPAMAPLLPLWQEKSLAFVHACGSPDPTRSHFDAQAYLENGTPGRKTTNDGWMARLLEVLPGPRGPAQAIAIGAAIPLILTGKLPVANLPLNGPEAFRPSWEDGAAAGGIFDRLYQGGDALSRTYQEGKAARAAAAGDRELPTAADEETRMADNGAPPPGGFARTAQQLGRLMQRDPGIQLVFLSFGGWDSHVGEGTVLASRLRPLADGLAALRNALGQAFADTVVLVMSEFGRRLKENGAGGTDHGRASAFWVMGGGIAGGRFWGTWPGLAADGLTEGIDLAVTTDYRSVASTIVERSFGLSDNHLLQVFPDAAAPPQFLRGLLKA